MSATEEHIKYKDAYSIRPFAEGKGDLALEVNNLTVAYRAYFERPTTFKESVLKAIQERRIRNYSTFDALSKVSFQVKRGEVFGIMGSNGAGKSTLLKTLVGVVPPTKGQVKIWGKVDSLIGLGAGFDSDLNAIENIYLNFSLFGYTKDEIKRRIPGILEFAELSDFAGTPIKYYSSGMAARLGFSVAIDRDPDILIVDEVLAVGDERFQQKCNKVFEDFLARNKTVVIVSHSIGMLEQMCDRIGLLSKGNLVFCGEPKRAVELYREGSYQTVLS